MSPLLMSLGAGLVGTTLMTLVMAMIHRAGVANADMIRALGSWYTKTYENALAIGLLVHYTAGLVFSIPYAVVLGAFSGGGPLVTLGLGALLGLAHGLAMSLLLVAVVSERHPVERFRAAGVDVAAAHVLGHVVYGVGVASVVVVLGIDWGVRLT